MCSPGPHRNQPGPPSHQARDGLIETGVLERGRGKGGSVRRAVEEPLASQDDADLPLALEEENGEEGAETGDEGGFTLPHTQEVLATRKPAVAGGRKPRRGGRPAEDTQVVSYRHLDKRVNNPEVGMVHPENDPDRPKTVWSYDPHIDPALQFDSGRAAIER